MQREGLLPALLVRDTRAWDLTSAGDKIKFDLGAAGDAVAMDCRLVHYGGANSSEAPRVQLSATFRRGEHGGDGFTYRLRDSLKLTLGDVAKIHGY